MSFKPQFKKLDQVTDPAGSDTQVQFNDNGIFGGANINYVKASGYLGLGGTPTHRLTVLGTVANDGISTNIGLNFTTVDNAPAPTLALVADATGLLGVGRYYYMVTFLTALGETSGNALNESNITTDASHLKVQITLPISSDPRVTGRKIYRSTVAHGILGYYWILNTCATINDNTTETYIDNIPDASLDTNIRGFQRPNTTSNFVSLNGTRSMVMDANLTSFGYNSGLVARDYGNTFFGVATGIKVTSGQYNTFIGYNAGVSTTTGAANIALGGAVFGANTTGGSNIVISPYNGLAKNTTGGNNTAIGYQSLYNNTTASYNIAIGDYSLYTQSTGGNSNTALGHYAGYSCNTANNVFLGYHAGRYETGAKKLFIDGINRTDEATSRTNSIIYGVMDATVANQTLTFNAKVGIGTIPLVNLDIYNDSPVMALRHNAGTGTLRFVAANGVNYIQSGQGTTVDSAAPLVFSTLSNGREWARLDASGNFGIGISPTAKLHVGITNNSTTLAASSAQIGLRLRNTDTTTNNWTLIQSDSGGGTVDAIIGFQHVDQTNHYADIIFATRGTSGWGQRVKITSNGNLAIGTGSSHTPNAGLGITKTIDNSGYVFGMTIEGSYASSSTQVYAMWMNPTLKPAANSSATAFYANATIDGTNLINNAYGGYIAALTLSAGSVNNVYGLYIGDQTIGGTNNWSLYANGTSRSYFGGAVGIGVAPTAKIHIKGTGTTTGETLKTTDSAGTARFTVRDNGTINIVGLPTSSAGLASGDVWNDSGVLKII